MVATCSSASLTSPQWAGSRPSGRSKDSSLGAGHEGVERRLGLRHALVDPGEHHPGHRRVLAVGEPEEHAPATDLHVVGVRAEAEHLERSVGQAQADHSSPSPAHPARAAPPSGPWRFWASHRSGPSGSGPTPPVLGTPLHVPVEAELVAAGRAIAVAPGRPRSGRILQGRLAGSVPGRSLSLVGRGTVDVRTQVAPRWHRAVGPARPARLGVEARLVGHGSGGGPAGDDGRPGARPGTTGRPRDPAPDGHQPRRHRREVHAGPTKPARAAAAARRVVAHGLVARPRPPGSGAVHRQGLPGGRLPRLPAPGATARRAPHGDERPGRRGTVARRARRAGRARPARRGGPARPAGGHRVRVHGRRPAVRPPGGLVVAGRDNFQRPGLRAGVEGGRDGPALPGPHDRQRIRSLPPHAERLVALRSEDRAVAGQPPRQRVGPPQRLPARVGAAAQARVRAGDDGGREPAHGGVVGRRRRVEVMVPGRRLAGLPGQAGVSRRAIALTHTFRRVADRHGLVFLVNGTWSADDGGGYPDADVHGNALADGAVVEHHDGQIDYFGPYGCSDQWAAESPVTDGEAFNFAVTAPRRAWPSTSSPAATPTSTSGPPTGPCRPGAAPTRPGCPRAWATRRGPWLGRPRWVRRPRTARRRPERVPTGRGRAPAGTARGPRGGPPVDAAPQARCAP